MTILTERERVTIEILLDKGRSFIEVADKLLESRNRRMRNDMAAEVATTMGRKLYPLPETKSDTDEREDETFKPEGTALEEIDRLKEEVIALSDEKEIILAQNKAYECLIKIEHKDIAKFITQELSESEAIKALAMKQGGYETERIASHLLTMRFLPLWNRIRKDVCSIIEEVYNIPVIEEEKNEKEKVDLRDVYKSIAVRKRWLGDEMGRAENKLEKLEKLMKLSHPESMALRREAREYVKTEAMV